MMNENFQIKPDSWMYSITHNSICKVIEVNTLWGETTCRVWIPGNNTVASIPVSVLGPIESSGKNSSDYITYVVSAAKIMDALNSDVLIAPIESSVIPLPHQINTLSRAIKGHQIRYLLADEVGLGKTIEAGLILRELKLRGSIKRILILAPKGLVIQWVSEMQTHFNERFQLVLSEDLKTFGNLSENLDADLEQISGTKNPWSVFSQVIVSIDSVKPLDKRRGWSASKVKEYNKKRFEDLISADWDLIIVDEAHRLGGSTDQVARFKLGQGLSEASPYLLMLTATPHQGKRDSFHRLLSLVDPQNFPDIESVTRDRVKPYVIRTEKRNAITAEGDPLFTPRKTILAPVSWEEKHHDQKILYEAVTEYVREGYNQSKKEKRNYIGFLMILMQRLVVSSTNAIQKSLERRLEVLESAQGQTALFSFYSEEEWEEMDGQEQMERMLTTGFKALKNEHSQVKLLLEATSKCKQLGPDAKAEALLDWIYRIQAEEGDTEFKILVFTEFVPTQEMLEQFLSDRGFTVTCLNGSLDMEDRKKVQEEFENAARILISTDAGGEGLNLQFCHVVINYDIPWNPMRLEQRIGRVDRIGQNSPVRAINFVFENSVEHRVREVLEQKLAIIFEEFGIDKTGDVLDSAQSGEMFDELYINSLLEPEKVEESVDSMMKLLRNEVMEAKNSLMVLGETENPQILDAQRVMEHPLRYWTEKMTIGYLKSQNGDAIKRKEKWDLTWPDGIKYSGVRFDGKAWDDKIRHLSLGDSRIINLMKNIPRYVYGEKIPVIPIEGLKNENKGLWSLWQISITSRENVRKRIIPIYVTDDERIFKPTAKYIWDHLLTSTHQIVSNSNISQKKLERIQNIAKEQGESIYKELVEKNKERLEIEKERMEYNFKAKRRAIEKIGLPQVRNHRLMQLSEKEQIFQKHYEDRRIDLIPEMFPIILIRTVGEDHE